MNFLIYLRFGTARYQLQASATTIEQAQAVMSTMPQGFIMTGDGIFVERKGF